MTHMELGSFGGKKSSQPTSWPMITLDHERGTFVSDGKNLGSTLTAVLLGVNRSRALWQEGRRPKCSSDDAITGVPIDREYMESKFRGTVLIPGGPDSGAAPQLACDGCNLAEYRRDRRACSEEWAIPLILHPATSGEVFILRCTQASLSALRDAFDPLRRSRTPLYCSWWGLGAESVSRGSRVYSRISRVDRGGETPPEYWPKFSKSLRSVSESSGGTSQPLTPLTMP